MKSLNDIFAQGRQVDEIISDLKTKSVEIPNWDNLELAYEHTKHKIVGDYIGRKDKVRGDGITECAARISIGLEKLLCNRISEFMFAIPVRRIYHNIEGNEKRQAIAKAIEMIYKYARVMPENKKRARSYFASCEFCTIWYAVKNPNTMYGFQSEYKLKCKTFSPMDGTKLYPLFDEYGDMIAMSIQYERKVQDTTVYFFETYTANRHIKWEQKDSKWENVTDDEVAILKIPAIYAYRPAPIYDGLSNLREEIEYSLSRNSDVVAYNSAPMIVASGLIEGTEEKGETRRVFQVDSGGDVKYVSWSQSTSALEFHVNMMLKLFWQQAQMPDISFDTMSHLGGIGYDARQTLLTDAHLKVGDESGAWLEVFERECSVIKAFLKKLNVSWADEIDNVEVEHVITPYIQNDETATAQRLLSLNGGKPILSQLESIQEAGYSNDPEATLKQIQEESVANAKLQMELQMEMQQQATQQQADNNQ